MMNIFNIFTVALLITVGCQKNSVNNQTATVKGTETKTSMNDSLQTITLGAGCFWCVEAIFDQLEGVHSVVSGYSGGHDNNPNYKSVCSGTTGHAEVCQLQYDSSVISLAEVLEVFFKTHNPTTLNRQGADVGTQYRSAIFYHDDSQKEVAERVKKELNASGAYDDPIVTEITAYSNFFPAEDYHQQYFELNGQQPYCRAVIQPKVDKFQKVFKDKIKH